MIYVEPKVRGISEQKKLFKKIKFISIEQIEELFKWNNEFIGESDEKLWNIYTAIDGECKM